MAGSFRLYKHFRLDKKLSDHELQVLCGTLVHDLPFDAPIKPSQLVKPIQERRIKVGTVPQAPIIKMMKKRYVDAFFSRGEIQLGSFHYYSGYDHTEIGDTSEGVVTLIGKMPTGYIGGTYGYGYNNLILCTYAGQPERSTLDRFGYDGGFIISNPKRFAQAIAATLESKAPEYALCKYSPHKAIIGCPGGNVDVSQISHRTAEIVKAAKYFIKPDRYSHQKEFRFLWEVDREILDAELVVCEEAVQWCRPL